MRRTGLEPIISDYKTKVITKFYYLRLKKKYNNNSNDNHPKLDSNQRLRLMRPSSFPITPLVCCKFYKYFISFLGTTGLEPARRKALDFKSNVYTNFTKYLFFSKKFNRVDDGI